MQDTDIPVKVFKENINSFVEQITLQFIDGICSSKALNCFNLPIEHLPSNKVLETLRITIDQWLNKLLLDHFDHTFSKFQCDFRYRSGMQH